MGNQLKNMALSICNKPAHKRINLPKVIILVILLCIAPTLVYAEDNERKIVKSVNHTTTTVKIGGDKVVEQHVA